MTQEPIHVVTLAQHNLFLDLHMADSDFCLRTCACAPDEDLAQGKVKPPVLGPSSQDEGDIIVLSGCTSASSALQHWDRGVILSPQAAKNSTFSTILCVEPTPDIIVLMGPKAQV